MPYENANFIFELDETWPLGTDNVSQGDDHVRQNKRVLKNQFPNLTGAVTATTEELNSSGIPTGALIIHAGATAPNGYVFCRGQELSRTSESELYLIIGTLYGSGNGSTTFNVPDMQTRVPGGSSGSDALGSVNGKNIWTANDLPAHKHSVTGGAHAHALQTSSFDNPSGSNRVADKNRDNNDTINTNTDGSHAHTVSNTGSGGDNRQSTLYLNYLIKL